MPIGDGMSIAMDRVRYLQGRIDAILDRIPDHGDHDDPGSPWEALDDIDVMLRKFREDISDWKQWI